MIMDNTRKCALDRRLPLSLHVLVIAAALLPVANGFATEQSALSLTAYRTYIKTNNTSLYTNSNNQAGWSATSVSCPSTATNGCTISVHVDATCEAPNTGYVEAILSSTGGTINPVAGVELNDFGSSQGYFTANAFTWMITGVSANTAPSITVYFTSGSSGYGAVGAHTLSVTVYTN
jgi:hypothetical protein